MESTIRQRLLDPPRMRAFEGRRKFALHLTSEEQKDNFELLIIAFCRRFASSSKECCNLNVGKERKAAFSAVWMKTLANFEPFKTTQERSILEHCSPAANNVSHEDVHYVFSVIHEMVYTIFHKHIRKRKDDCVGSENTGGGSSTELAKESDETLYRYCGAALQRMIKLRKETLATFLRNNTCYGEGASNSEWPRDE